MLGAHTNTVRRVAYNADLRACVTGSWDKTVRVWDAHAGAGGAGAASAASARQAVAKVDVPDRVYSMALLGGTSLVVGTANRHVLIYDLRKLSAAASAPTALISSRESTLKHQTRYIAAPPAGDFLAVASTEGRVAIDYLGAAEAGASYAFKCHRRKEADGSETAFPVHALAFHPVYGTFATGGGDGNIATWDARGRKRLAAIGPYPNSIAALAFSPDGAHLALSAAYDFSQGDAGSDAARAGRAPDAIHIRVVGDAEVRPKAAAAPAAAAGAAAAAAAAAGGAR